MISWKLPEDVELLEGSLTENIDPMASGQVYSTSIVVRGKPFDAQASFVEVYSVVNGTKLGAVYPIELKKTLEAHISGANESDSSGIKSLNKQQEVESKFKLFY